MALELAQVAVRWSRYGPVTVDAFDTPDEGTRQAALLRLLWNVVEQNWLVIVNNGVESILHPPY